MSRAPLGSHAVSSLDELVREVGKVRAKRAPKPAPDEHAWWPKSVKLPAESAKWLRDTPIESIQALLCDPDTKLGYDYGNEREQGGKLTLEVPSTVVLRQAILALRLSMTDSAKLAEYYRLKSEREKLNEKIEKLGEALPREVLRG